jgi:hypothetical protein
MRYKGEIQNNTDFYITLGDFLDEFYAAPFGKKAAMIEVEPIFDKEITGTQRCFFAAAVHKLANDYGLPVPAWVFDRAYYLNDDEPFFGGEARGTLRQYFMYTSPPEFKHRNMFVDPAALVRV